MKNLKFYSSIFAFLVSVSALAQVQVDKQIQLTGSGSDAKLTGIQQVSQSSDAVNAQTIQQNVLVYAADAGSANSYSVTLAPAITSYNNGMIVNFIAANANTGASTLSVNGLPAATIKKQVINNLVANDILANQSVSVMYDGVNFQMLSLLGNSGGSTSHSIGELYGGGIVVAVWDSSGTQHGLIASLTNISLTASWISSAYQATTVPNPGATSINNGAANTAAMIAQGDNSGAAYICHNYTDGIYHDWYLPAIWELVYCYNAAFIVNNVLGNTDGFQGNYYWSSTEYDNTRAWYETFGNGQFNGDGGKDFLGKDFPYGNIRAVRRF